MHRSQLSRFYYINRAVGEGTYPTCRSMAQKLEVHERTINRDLDFLRNEWSAPLEFDPGKNGWYYTKPFRLPFPRLSAGEALALLFGLELMNQCRGTGLEESVGGLLAKLPAILPEDVSLDEETLRQGVSFSLEPLRGNRERVAEFSRGLREAIGRRRPVEINYYTPARDEATSRRVDPYHLHYFQGAWYLVGHCYWRGEVRTFAVDRIIQLRVLADDPAFAVPPDFSAREYFDQAWRLERGGQTAKVVVRFTPYLARWLRGREYHPSQVTVEGEDGSLTLAFTVRGLAEIKRWLLQFGAEAEVLAPPELRAELGEEGRRLAGRYGG